MKRPALMIILTVALCAPAKTDQLTLGFFQNSTDNLFQTAYPEKDQVSQLTFSLAKDFRPVSFFTEGAYSHLYQNPNISYYGQDLGVDFVQPLSEKTGFYAAVKGGGAFYRADYQDFNHLSFGFLGAVKSYLSGSSILKASYTFAYKNYQNQIFDFTSHLVNLSLDRYFETSTTLKAEANWGFKSFLHPFVAFASEPAEPEPPADGRHGYGGHGQGGSQMGWRDGIPKPGLTTQGQSIQILSAAALLAQGLGNNIGIRASGLRQWTISGENPFASIDEFYMVENPTYDIFSWNGYIVSGLLTFEAPWNTQLKLGYTGSLKEFPGIEAMNLDGETLGFLREDKRSQWEARWEKNFPTLSLYLNYLYVNNRSNDLLFEWQGHFLSVGVEWSLNWGSGR
ncbi:MAG: hypothetical protein WBC70_05420 [Candidatus Aminicenantales bacterium]